MITTTRAIRKILVPRMMGVMMLSAISASASPDNDAFTNSVQLTGTNITYSGTLTGATLEPGEPQPFGTNTVWVSWEAPATGYVQVAAPSYWAVFTGPTVDHLQQVALIPRYFNNLYRFVVTERTVYHFQFSGGADIFTFSFQL